jgi:formate hydrogenlyase transcriptional activator
MGKVTPKQTVAADVSMWTRGEGRRYEAVLRISEALSACREPEDLTEILSEQLREFVDFSKFYIIVYKQNSTEVEWAVLGAEKSLISVYADVPVEDRPSWRVYATQEPFHIANWDEDERVPPRLKQGIVAQGLELGPLVFVPLTTPHRRLGALGMSGRPETVYSSEDIGFLRLIGRVVAFAIDDNFNLRHAEAAQAELHQQNILLEQTEKELRDLINNIPAQVNTLTNDGRVGFVNQQMLDYFGKTVEEIRDWASTDVVHPDDLANVIANWRRTMESGEPDEMEARLRRADGVYRWFLCRRIPLRDAEGNLIRWYGVRADIEDLKRAEGSLVIQNNRLQLLLKLTKEITSSLEFRELLRAISASIREVMDWDAVQIWLADSDSGKFRLYALDFPEGKGFVKEGILIESVGACKRALETLQPTIRNIANPEDFPPDLYRLMLAEGLKSQCVMPLVSRGRAVAALTINRRTDDPFLPDEIDFIKEASGQIAIAIENCLAFSQISDLKEKLAQEKVYLEEEIRGEMDFEQIVGNSPALKHVLQLVETVAPNDSTVLLLGETGTGKELIARAIHDRSRRKDRTFVKVNCAAIPTGLLESELFGHEKGAFTGAISQKVGRLELADQGTLFLDEVGDIPIEIQPKLMRALQEQEFERLGSTRTRKVNVRLIAATNRDLERMIAAREFRSDLYYRLNVFPIRMPPLRERRQDIPLLVSYFVQKFAKQMQKKIETIPPAVMRALTAWEWPGNVRELGNFVERAVILTRDRSLAAPLAELRKVTVDESRAAARNTATNHDDVARIVKETINALNGNITIAGDRVQKHRDRIVSALVETRGRVGGADGAAVRMGVNRTTLLARMKKLGIDPHDYS